MKKAPCKECENRHVGCHGECEAYKTWTEDRKELNRKIRDDGEAWRAFYDVRKHHLSKEDQERYKYKKK